VERVDGIGKAIKSPIAEGCAGTSKKGSTEHELCKETAGGQPGENEVPFGDAGKGAKTWR